MRVFLAPFAASVLLASAAFAQNPNDSPTRSDFRLISSAVTPALRDVTPLPPDLTKPQHEKTLRPLAVSSSNQVDPVQQLMTTTKLPVSSTLSFDGVGISTGYAVNAAPPDTNGAVGATQYVQWVNEAFAVYNKSTGAQVYGPAAGNTLWQHLPSGSSCAANNDGDPIAQYDKLANRWVMTQFSVTGGPPFYQCVAVSETSDATGAWFIYQFQTPGSNFPDYPKLGIWPDGYYFSFNMFQGNFFAGAMACALNRSAMLTGAATSGQCFTTSSSFGGLLPSDLDGPASPPPTGAPNYYVNFGSSSLNYWKFHVDWTTPANSSFQGPANLPVASFSAACNGGTCIPQPSTRQKLDSLADRVMYRLAYRNFGTYQALVVNHSVRTSLAASGVRWYELHFNYPTTPTLSVFQQGTFGPDGTSRWMGSIAMDKTGDIAVGYSASSTSVRPGIRLTGRVPTDTPGTLEAESVLLNGIGSQLPNLSRWGDYSAMTVDPVDDCTFWYTNEYLTYSGKFNWSTHISSFKFSSCQ